MAIGPRVRVVVPLVAAWLITLPTDAVVGYFIPSFFSRPILPYLLAQGASCFYSSPVHILIVLLFATVAVVVADFAKPMARSWSGSLAVLLFQIVLVLDVIRAYGGEWWTYFASVAGLTPTPPQLGGLPGPPISDVRWPWISAIVGLAVASYLVLTAPKSAKTTPHSA